MALRYKVYERKNNLPNAKRNRVAVAYPKMIGRITLRELADDIADRCTVHRADVRAVLDVLSVSAMSFMTKGFGVDLGDMGSFSFRFRSKAADTKDAFEPELIKKALIHYTPSREMKARLATTSILDVEDLTASKSKKPGTSAPDPATPGTGGEPKGEDEPKDGDL